MMQTRRMTIDPPLAEGAFAQFCAANPDMETSGTRAESSS